MSVCVGIVCRLCICRRIANLNLSIALASGMCPEETIYLCELESLYQVFYFGLLLYRLVQGIIKAGVLLIGSICSIGFKSEKCECERGSAQALRRIVCRSNIYIYKSFPAKDQTESAAFWRNIQPCLVLAIIYPDHIATTPHSDKCSPASSVYRRES